MTEPNYDLSDPDAVFFCPSCGSGYTAKATRCVDCDEQLVARSRVETQSHEQQNHEHDSGAAVRLCRIVDRVEASFLEEDLDKAGIPFLVKELGAEPSLLSGAVGGTFDFFVTDRDLPRALDLVRRLEVPDPESENEE